MSYAKSKVPRGEREKESKGEKYLLVVFEWGLGFRGCCGS
jgi:hypothetical protein